ncbi:MAG: lectin like domain-containing protein [Elusimicrobia bacterium]|nr:lectin like domain-containing protein [Elusimicrobiota bacterium]
MKKKAISFIMIVLMGPGMFAYADMQCAPVSAGFKNYLINMQQGKAPKQSTNNHASGLIPSPVDFSHTRGKRMAKRLNGLPAPLGYLASYDLRSQGKVTPIRDQGAYNTCWAFATYSALESYFLPLDTQDFSENNLVNLSGFDLGYDGGGTYGMSTAYLTRWGGPVYESDDPYPNKGGSPPGSAVQAHVQEALFIPDRSSVSDNDNIKQMITDVGAVMTSIYMNIGATYYNPINAAYYYSGTAVSNHGVALVGWDDNYDKTNFSTVPPGNGAFIVKNSWGSSWGNAGYFYVSYYDTNIGTDNAVFERNGNYQHIYQYDPLGMSTAAGYSSTTGWFANVFTATSNDQLDAVGFYSTAMDATYEIYVYDSFSGSSFSGLLGKKTGTIPVTGYHTIRLDSSIPISANRTFCVVVKMTTPGYAYPIPLEYPISGYSSPTAAAGQSYISHDGAAWGDITTVYTNTNVCLKAYTGSSLSNAVTDLSGVVVYPNPVCFETAVRGKLKFDNLTDSAKVQIFDVTGGLVKTLKPGTAENDGISGRAEWNGKNEDGDGVSMGLYLYLITDEPGHKKTGKIGVVK